MKDESIIKVLWLAPHFNHYKARFLNSLQKHGRINLFIYAGETSINKGYAQFDIPEMEFELRKTNVPKASFGHSLKVLCDVFKWHHQEKFDWIMVPCEAKNFFLVLFLSVLRFFCNYRLFSYNHAVLGTGKKNTLLSKLMYCFYNRIVFYTENERRRALDLRLLSPSKAFFANNTLDNIAINKCYSFHIKDLGKPTLLFIGRLIPNKQIELLLHYHQRLKNILPELKLLIIGDGPEAPIVQKALKSDLSIQWFGALSDEGEISPIMQKANAVINLGASGLSVMHSFAYGKPYIAIENPQNGPECWYLRSGYNGLLLKSGNDYVEYNAREIVSMLNNTSQYELLCKGAYETAQKYSVQAWVEEITECLTK